MEKDRKKFSAELECEIEPCLIVVLPEKYVPTYRDPRLQFRGAEGCLCRRPCPSLALSGSRLMNCQPMV